MGIWFFAIGFGPIGLVGLGAGSECVRGRPRPSPSAASSSHRSPSGSHASGRSTSSCRPREHTQRSQRDPPARLTLAVLHLDRHRAFGGRSRAASGHPGSRLPSTTATASAMRSSGSPLARGGSPARAARRSASRSGTRTGARRARSPRRSTSAGTAGARAGTPRPGGAHPPSVRAVDRPLVLEQTLEDVDRRVERRHLRAVLDLAVPAAVGDLLAEEPLDERRMSTPKYAPIATTPPLMHGSTSPSNYP